MTRQIDTFSESIISVDQAAAHVSTISGKKRNRSVILRWANRGVSGVKLPTIRIGGEIYTSQTALNEFLNESREAKRAKRSQATATGMRRAKLDRQLEEQLEEQAAELGI